MKDWAPPVTLLAAAYFLAGRLSLLLATGDGYSAPVWPAAGVALTGILVWGTRAWPGIVIGSFLVNVGTGLDTRGLLSALHSALLPAGIAGGAALQALLGAGLIRRFTKFPSPLDRPRNLLIAALLGGPLSCIVSATAGGMGLLLSGTIGPDALPSSWSTWWVGDTLGVVLVLPLVTTWRTELRDVSSRTRWFVALPVGLAVTLTVVLFLYARAAEHRLRQAEFQWQTTQVTRALEKELVSYVDVLYAIDGLFRASQRVERPEFQTFLAHEMARHPGIQALEWIPRVAAGDRLAHETSARRDGLATYQITERDPDGRLRPAPPRATYFPAYYVAPYAGNEAALGFDLLSDPIRWAAMERARDAAAPTATPRVTLVQVTGGQFGLLVFLPIYATNADLATVEARRQHLLGFAAGVFRLDDMVRAALAGAADHQVSYRLEDTSAPADQLLLSASGAVTPPGSPLQTSVALDFAGRRWRLKVSPTTDSFDDQRWGGPREMLTGGLLLSSLLGIFLSVVAGRTHTIERVVRERTDELSRANQQLELEIGERQRASDALRESEERHRAIFETAVEGIITIDEGGIVQAVNPAAERIFGYSAVEMVGSNVNRLQPEPYSSLHDEYLRRYLRTGQARIIGVGREVEGRRKDGSTFPLHLSVSEMRQGDRRGFTGIVRDISDEKLAEAEIRRVSERFQELADNIREVFWLSSADGSTLEYVSPAYEEIWGRARENLYRRALDWVEAIHPDDRPAVEKAFAADSLASGGFDVEYRIVRPDGTVRHIHDRGFPVRDETGAIVRIAGIAEDITVEHQIRADLTRAKQHLEERVEERTAELRASLAEKDTLLREVHHRVKNNLQLIASLVDLQAGQEAEPQALEALRETHGRVRSMAMVHEALYRSATLATVAVGPYLERLARHLYRSHGVRTEDVSLHIAVENVQLPLDALVNCGLIANELISNAFKYAFRGRTGTLQVGLHREGVTLVLTVADDGVGLPADFDIDATETLGIQIVSNLAQQLRGTFHLERSKDTRFEVRFPDPSRQGRDTGDG